MYKKSKKPLPFKKKLLFAGLIAILAICAGGLYVHFHDRNTANLINTKAGKTVQGAVSQPTPHQQLPTNTSTSQSGGGVVDNSGQVTNSLPDSSLWVSSNSGNITLQQPSPNTVVKSGDTLSGLAKVKTVQFILTDSSVGLISQGSLGVVNGKFSGTLQFTPHSNSGKLEIYYPNPDNGAEEDIVEINVNFNT